MLVCLYNAVILDCPIIARIDGEVLTYANGESDDTVWPGQLIAKTKLAVLDEG